MIRGLESADRRRGGMLHSTFTAHTNPSPIPALLHARAIERFERRRQRRILAAKLLLLAGALWVIVLRIGVPHLARPLGAALLMVLVPWACAFAIALGIFFAISWDDFGDLLLSALRASAPAMWFTPAMLLLSKPSFGAVLVGLLLVANTTRVLVSRSAPHNLAPSRPPASRRKRERLFGYGTVETGPSFWREGLPAVISAFALQTGLCGSWAGHPIYAAVLIASGVAIWTWSSISRGASRRHEDPLSHWPLNIALTLLLTTSLSIAQMPASGPPVDSGLLETMRRMTGGWQFRGAPEVQAPKRSVARLVSARRDTSMRDTSIKELRKREIGGPVADMVPGVILRVEAKPVRQVLAAPPPAHARHSRSYSIDRPLDIPFTGEYQVFPESSAHLKHDWAVESGTLLDHVYATTLGGSLETEAFQRFHPPIDFAGCGKIGLVFVSEEEGPFGVTMQLAVEDGLIDLGTEMVGFDRQSEETLEFTVPPGHGNLVVGALRASFHRVPQQGRQSMKVVVRRFILAPRGQ
jgi:hypothetical protein